MAYKDKIEGYLLDLSLSYEEKGENLWVVFGEETGLENVIITVEEPLVILRVNVMGIPSENRESFFEELLRLNGNDLAHGAYGIEGEGVVLIDTLEVDTLDLQEFQASLDALGLALVQHYATLMKYRKAK